MKPPASFSTIPPTKREQRVEAIATIVRELTRFPSGTPRISPQKAREIGEYIYQWLVAEKVALP